jgi:signal transduction histidine kinase
MAANELDRIFDKFVTGQAQSQRDSSTGLGLHFVKTTIEERGGKIWVESEPHVGSAFFFLWPKVSENL